MPHCMLVGRTLAKPPGNHKTDGSIDSDNVLNETLQVKYLYQKPYIYLYQRLIYVLLSMCV